MSPSMNLNYRKFMCLLPLQGLKAIHSPHTGIVDYGRVARSFGENFQRLGGDVLTEFEVSEFRLTQESSADLSHPVTVINKQGQVTQSLCL